MANIKKSEGDTKAQVYIIIPRNQDTYEEKFAVCGAKKYPFEIPVHLTREQVVILERQKQPFQVDNQLTVHEAMDKYQCTQAQAAKIVSAQSTHKEIGGKTIKWRSKYILQSA